VDLWGNNPHNRMWLLVFLSLHVIFEIMSKVNRRKTRNDVHRKKK
jgi:hypothetical protein